MTQALPNQFLEERRRTRLFFNRISPLYPIVERHLFPEYRRVLDLATGTGLLAGAFSERGHALLGLDFADKLLKQFLPHTAITPSAKTPMGVFPVSIIRRQVRPVCRSVRPDAPESPGRALRSQTGLFRRHPS